MYRSKNSEREFGVVLMRYSGKSLKEIGLEFGLTRERVRQIIYAAHVAAGMDPNRPDLYTYANLELNKMVVRDGYGVVLTTDGKEVKIDINDWPIISQHRWRSHQSKTKNREVRYATASKGTLMHRVILGLQKKDGKIVDHINGDGLDNRRANLRLATPSQNVSNMKKWRGKSRYKGVSYNAKADRWLATIVVNYKQIHLGHWMTEEQAARAYDEASIEYRGEFANLNFPPVGSKTENSDETITCGVSDSMR